MIFFITRLSWRVSSGVEVIDKEFPNQREVIRDNGLHQFVVTVGPLDKDRTLIVGAAHAADESLVLQPGGHPGHMRHGCRGPVSEFNPPQAVPFGLTQLGEGDIGIVVDLCTTYQLHIQVVRKPRLHQMQ